MFSFNGQGFEILLNFITFFASSVLGTLTFVKDRKSWTNRLFGILALLIDTYIVVNYLSLHPPQATPESQLFWIRIVMFVCSFIGPTLLLLVINFPGRLFLLKNKFLIPLLSLMCLSAGASLSNLVFESIGYPNGSPVPVPGAGIVIFALDFVGLFLVSFGVLIYKYRKAVDQEKAKLLLFLLGVLFTFTFMGVFTVVAVVLFKTSSGVFFGPISFVILSSFVAFAIIKHGLFNIKVIATKILIVTLWIIFFSRIFLNESTRQYSIDIVLFLVIFIFGIGLSRSVEREVKQKEAATSMADSLEIANLKLQELDRQKTEFLSIASHQLRTPLSILKGYIELIEDGGYGKITKETGQILKNMDESNEHLIKLVDEFLNISRIEQGRAKYNFADFDIINTVKGVVVELDKRAEDKGLKLKMAGKGVRHIVGDEEKIRHVVFNFVDNAIKYTEKGVIEVGVDNDKDGLKITVSDHGFGFEKVDEVNFFQKFYRGQNVKNTNVTGTGLGLYVCRKFIEAHGGKVWARSVGLGKGSEFCFWLPLKPIEVVNSAV